MLILKLAFRNLLRHPRKSLTIGGLIALGIAALFVANAVFESSDRGLRSSFVRSMTGDAALSAKGPVSYGLFGSEVPIVSEYESIPPIAGFSALSEDFDGLDGLEAWTPLVSAAAQLRVGRVIIGNVPVFGVDPSSYFDVCPDIVVDRGDLTELADGGVFLNAKLAELAEARIKRALTIGESLTFSMYSNGSFKVRTGRFAGVHSYPGGTEVMDRLALADATLVRGLVDYTLGYVSAGDREEETDAGADLDDLFADAGDAVASADDAMTLDDVEDSLADTAERDLLVSEDAAAWSFALFRASPGREADLLRSLRRLADDGGYDVRAMDWRQAAGSNAQALFAVQGAFYVGMGFIALGAVLVIMNALVISVLERSAEIGTMRGLGAGSGFIRNLFITESMLLTMAAALTGVIVGLVVTFAAARSGIALENPLLVSLFGGSTLRPIPSPSSVALHLGLAAAVGALAWIYPVSLALRVQPISAMNGR